MVFPAWSHGCMEWEFEHSLLTIDDNTTTPSHEKAPLPFWRRFVWICDICEPSFFLEYAPALKCGQHGKGVGELRVGFRKNDVSMDCPKA